ncbi:MAG TPA: hypothetical protein V6C78_32440 [Crinalium sp.]|jgi:hypothetical protein
MASIRVGHYEVGWKQLLESHDAVKAARPVWRGDDGTGVKNHLASVLPYFLTISNNAQERELEAALVSLLRLGCG